MGDVAYVYGEHNGSEYRSVEEESSDGKCSGVEFKTHWDPRISVQRIAGTVQVGIVPPSDKDSTREFGVWNHDDGQFLSLNRSGLNRLIEALQEAGATTYGRDRW